MNRKLIILIFLLFLNSCATTGSAFLGPIITGAKTGSIYQASISYSTGKIMNELVSSKISSNENGKIFIVASNGKLLNSNYSNQDLPFIFGKPKINDFLKFKKIIDQSKIDYKNIKYIYFFQSKRWDIEFKNDLVIKLPLNFTKETLNNSLLFSSNLNLKENKKIDLRVKNQIITNE